MAKGVLGLFCKKKFLRKCKIACKTTSKMVKFCKDKYRKNMLLDMNI
jgi:hypothetical protein